MSESNDVVSGRGGRGEGRANWELPDCNRANKHILLMQHQGQIVQSSYLHAQSEAGRKLKGHEGKQFKSKMFYSPLL